MESARFMQYMTAPGGDCFCFSDSPVPFAVFGLFGSRLFFESQTNNPVIIEYGVQYLQIVCIFSFGLFGEMMFERILQSTGQTFYCMITQSTGAIINIILDPILIFGLFGVPKMGIQGAAAATVFGQIVDRTSVV